jgi:hypothetical protein
MNDLGVITYQSQPCVLCDELEIRGYGSPSKLGQPPHLGLIPQLLEVEPLEWTALSHVVILRHKLTSFSVSCPPFFVKLYTILV